MDQVKFPTIQETIRKLKDDNTFETQFDSLLHYDIIPKDDQDRDVVNKIMKGDKLLQIDVKQSRAISVFVGSAIGDALGNQTDQFPIDYKRDVIKGFTCLDNLRSPRALYTDDTSLALCIADSFLCNQLKYSPSDIRHRFVLWWFESYNNGKSQYFREENKEKQEYNLSELKENVKKEIWNQFSFGIGITTFNNFIDFVQNPSKSRIKEYYGDQNSNGSLMRLSPIPILYHDNVKEAAEIAFQQSLLTNDGQEAAECCQLLSYLIVQIINIENTTLSPKKILDQICEEAVKDLILETSVLQIAKSELEKSFFKNKYNQCEEDRDWNWKNVNFKYSPTRSEKSPTGIGGYSMDALAMSLHLNYHSESFSQVVCRAANLGGDSDTVACISGMLAGAIYGLSKDLIEFHQQIYPSEQNSTAIRAYKLFNKQPVS